MNAIYRHQSAFNRAVLIGRQAQGLTKDERENLLHALCEMSASAERLDGMQRPVIIERRRVGWFGFWRGIFGELG